MKSTNAPIRRLLTSIFDFGFLRLVGFFFCFANDVLTSSL
nr:MAG TPA: hypothetical protein [Caudoviricetes sp.]DAV34035.1 MAG TPA: hypothetical protein [Caudoviricetes sp.]